MRLLLGILVAACISYLTLMPESVLAADPEREGLFPLLRFYNHRTNEHQYTTDEQEAARWRKLSHYKEHLIVGLVSPTKDEGTVRLYRGYMANGRHIYYVGAQPRSVRTVDDNFKAHVWVAGDGGRVGVYCSTWVDGGDVFFDDRIESVDAFADDTLKKLNVRRLRPQLTASYFVYPSPKRTATLARQSRAESPSNGENAERDSSQPQAAGVALGKQQSHEAGTAPQTSGQTDPANSHVGDVARKEGGPASQADDGVVRFNDLLLDEPVTSFEMTEDGRHVLFTHQLGNRVSVYDVLSGEVTKVIETPAPRSVICRSGNAYIANFGKGTISVFDRSLDWRLAATLRLLKPDMVYISAARGDKFKNELLVTCHGSGREASYQDSQIMLVDTRRNLCRNLSRDALATVSADGTIVYTQQSFNLSPSGGIGGWDYNRFTTPGADRDPLIRGGVMQTPYVYQLTPGSFLLSQSTVFGGRELQQMPGDFGNLIIPDLSQKLFYTLTADVLRAHSYNAAFTQIDIRPVEFPPGYDDIAKVVFPIYRIRDYMLDHPVAYTHGGRLHLFVLTATAGRVLIADIPAFREVKEKQVPLVPKDDSKTAATKNEPDAALAGPPEHSRSMSSISGSDKATAARPDATPKSFADVIAHCEQSVVRIETSGEETSGIGSGFVVDDRGTVVTNCHVLAAANEARVHFANGDTSEVLGTLVIDESRDIAVVKIASVDHAPLMFSDSLPRKGDEVIALGAPLGLAFTATRGIVSAVRSEEEFAREFGSERAGTWIQVDAALSPGNSGGPLINKLGQVVAMSTLASNGIAQNLNFGISALDISEAVQGSWTSTMIPLAEGAAKLKASSRSRSMDDGTSAETSQVSAESLSEYLETCARQYANLLRDLRKEGGRLNNMLQEMRRGDTFIPVNIRDDGDILRHRSQRGTKWYFRNERTKDRAIDFVRERINELNDLKSSLKGPDNPESLVNLASDYGPSLDGRDVGKVGFLSEAVVLTAINHNEVLIAYDGALYLIWLESTAGIASGEFLQARPAYVAGTATVESPSGMSTVVTLLRAVSKEALASAVPAKPAVDDTDEKQVDLKLAPKAKEPMRTWLDKSGKHSVKATLVAFDSKNVQLRKEDGTIVSVPPNSLSQADIDYLKERWQERQAAN